MIHINRSFSPSRIVVFIITLTILVLTGCETNTVLHSEKHVANVAKLKALDVYYVERNLDMSATTSQSAQQKKAPASLDERSSIRTAIAKFGYFEVGPKLTEFGPAMFQANGLAGTFRQLQASDFTSTTLSKPTNSASSLVLQLTWDKMQTQGFVKSLVMRLGATLYDPTGKTRLWSGQFNSALGDDPALGKLMTTRVDRAYIEGLLGTVLDQMSKDQLIELRAEKAIRPGGKK